MPQTLMVLLKLTKAIVEHRDVEVGAVDLRLDSAGLGGTERAVVAGWQERPVLAMSRGDHPFAEDGVPAALRHPRPGLLPCPAAASGAQVIGPATRSSG